MARPAVGVVGASARAAVHSLARAGFGAWAVDLFGDRDLTRVAPCAVCPLDDYPRAIPHLAEQFPSGPVMYTGGLENHPNVVAELARGRELLGAAPELLEQVRDPWRLFPTLASAGFDVPELVPPGEPCPATGRWLRKPIRSAGGLGIRFGTPGEPPSPDHYFQEFIDGTPMSAVYGGTTLLDVTEQLVGETWLHSRPFGYCGSIGPADVATGPLCSRLKSLPQLAFPALGNIDFVLSNGREVPVELNPRYSASVEVLELATGCSFVTLCLAPRTVEIAVAGKAIYYAPHALAFPASGPWDADLAGDFDPWRLPAFADIPAAGSHFEAGRPVITLMVSGSSSAECRQRLQSRAAELDQLFAETTR